MGRIVNVMNAYIMSYCPKCKIMHYGSSLLLHGAANIEKMQELIDDGKVVSEIYESFCGHCGGFIDGVSCGCGHTRRQHYYEE